MTSKISINPPLDHSFSIMQRILDGVLTIDTIEEFEEILGIYEKDPFLFRRYADLLHEKGRSIAAEQAYAHTAELFLELNMSLQAIVAKILQWSIRKPTHEQGRAFYAFLHEEGAQQAPLQKFWARMRYSELIAVMLRLVRLRLPAGATVLKSDEPAEDLFFIVSGCVAELQSSEFPIGIKPRANSDDEPILLAENDIFGDIFPLREPTRTRKEIRVVKDVELVKIAKGVLLNVCEKHPQIESLLLEMHRADRSAVGSGRSWQTVRRSVRFGLPTQAEIIFQPVDAADSAWQHSAIAIDLSLGGMCLDLGALRDEPGAPDYLPERGRSVRIRIRQADDDTDLYATGTIIWVYRKQMTEDHAVVIGIRFDPLSAIDKERLLDFCSDHGGEQNLLLTLWDTMVNVDNANG